MIIPLLRPFVFFTFTGHHLSLKTYFGVERALQECKFLQLAEKKAFFTGGGVMKMPIPHKNAKYYMSFLSHIIQAWLGLYYLRIQEKSIFFFYVKFTFFHWSRAENQFPWSAQSLLNSHEYIFAQSFSC